MEGKLFQKRRIQTKNKSRRVKRKKREVLILEEFWERFGKGVAAINTSLADV